MCKASKCLTPRRYLHYFKYNGSSSKEADFSDINNLFFLSSGSTVFAEIQGVIDACIKLSGMPDLSLSFMVGFLFSCFVVPCIPNTYEVLKEMITTEIAKNYLRNFLSKTYQENSLHN